MKPQEIKGYVVDVCHNVVVTFAEENNVPQEHLNVRIDMQNSNSKPVFGLFNQSKLIKQCTLKEVIRAGGGAGLGMLLGMYVRNIIRDIFIASLKRFELQETKEMFILLYINSEISSPMIAVFVKGQLMDAIDVGEIIEVSNENNPM